MKFLKDIGSFWSKKAKPALGNYASLMGNGYQGMVKGGVGELMKSGNPLSFFSGAVKGGLSGTQRALAVNAMKRQGTLPDVSKISKNIFENGDVPTPEAVRYEEGILKNALATDTPPPSNPLKDDKPKAKKLWQQIKDGFNKAWNWMKANPVATVFIVLGVGFIILIAVSKKFRGWFKRKNNGSKYN